MDPRLREDMRPGVVAVARAVPEGLAAVIHRRCVGNPLFMHGIIDLASVAPSPFSIAALAAAGDLPLENVEELCEALARRKQFLREAGTREMPDGTVSYCYEFMHTIEQQVINRRMPARRRSSLNRRFGEWLEATSTNAFSRW